MRLWSRDQDQLLWSPSRSSFVDWNSQWYLHTCKSYIDDNLYCRFIDAYLQEMNLVCLVLSILGNHSYHSSESAVGRPSSNAAITWPCKWRQPLLWQWYAKTSFLFRDFLSHFPCQDTLNDKAVTMSDELRQALNQFLVMRKAGESGGFRGLVEEGIIAGGFSALNP